MAGTHFSGPVYSAAGFVGNITGTAVTATTTVAGIVKQAASQPAAAGANPTKAEYDALLTAMRTAGLMA